MNWAGLFIYPIGLAVLAAIGYWDGEPVIGTIALVCAGAWIAVVTRGARWMEGLLGISGGIGLSLLFTGSGFYPILAGEVLALIGFEAGMSRREIAMFPQEHRSRFARRVLSLLALVGIGTGGLAAVVVNLRLPLRFLPALGVSVGVLGGLALLFRRAIK